MRNIVMIMTREDSKTSVYRVLSIRSTIAQGKYNHIKECGLCPAIATFAAREGDVIHAFLPEDELKIPLTEFRERLDELSVGEDLNQPLYQAARAIKKIADLVRVNFYSIPKGYCSTEEFNAAMRSSKEIPFELAKLRETCKTYNMKI